MSGTTYMPSVATKTISAAAPRPRLMPGMKTEQKARKPDAPRSRAASSSVKSKLLRRGVERQDGERQLRVDHDEQHRAAVVEQGGGFLEKVRRFQQLADRAVGLQQGLPGEDADEEIRPERDDDQQQEEIPPARARARHAEADRQRESEADQRSSLR